MESSHTLKRLEFVVSVIRNQLETAQSSAVIAAIWKRDRKLTTSRSFEDFAILVSSDLPSYRDEVLKLKDKAFDLYLYWTVEKLNEALMILSELDLQKISSLRGFKKSTQKVFEKELLKIHDLLNGGISTVQANVKNIFDNPKDNDVHLINLAGYIDRQRLYLQRVFWIIRYPLVKFIVLDLKRWHLIVAGLILIPVIYLLSPQNIESSLTLPERFSTDANELIVIMSQNETILSSLLSFIEFFISSVSAVPILLMLATVPLMFLRRYFFKSTSLSEKIFKKEEELRELAHSLNLPKNSLINIGEVDMSTKSITIQGSTINAPVTLADSIQSSLNTVGASETDKQAKELVEELLKEIAKIGAGWGESLEQVTNDSKALSNEIASESPRRRWYELSIEGITDAAKAIGEIGKPVIYTVEKLLPVLNETFA